jgi:hypothetical protein
MKRNEVTTAGSLKMGDRFYKQADSKKTVLEIVAGDKKVTNYQTYSVFAREPHKKHGDPMKSNTKVVFLRHGIIFDEVIV